MKLDDHPAKGYQKIARFLMLLSQEEAAKVMMHLTEQEVAGITLEIAKIDRVEGPEAAKLLKEFGFLVKTKDLVARGGMDKARKILTTAFGAEKAQSLVEKIQERTVPHPFAFLMDLDEEQVKLLLKDESPPVVAVILPHLTPELAARLLAFFPVEKQKEVVARVAKMKKINPEVLRRAEGALREKVRSVGEVVTRRIDGQAALVEILRYLDPGSERSILASLQETDRKLAETLEEKLFSPEILQFLADRDLQKVLRDYSDAELAVIIKGLSEEQRQRLAVNVSGRRWEMILADCEARGALRRSEVAKALREFLDTLRAEEAKGNIVINRRKDDVVL